MSQTNHNDCWVPVTDPPSTSRRVIIWTNGTRALHRRGTISQHLDTNGAWYDRRTQTWFHSDGTVAPDVTHWMEMPGRPKASRKIGDR